MANGSASCSEKSNWDSTNSNSFENRTNNKGTNKVDHVTN
jgi:hypothetical protein